MKKDTLRALGIGFLLSSILTGTFAIFGQGNVPVPGITVNSLFNSNNQDADAELAQYRDEVSQLQAEKSNLESEKEKLNESVSELTKALEEASNENARKSETTTTTSSNDNNDASENEEATTGSFSINDGEVSSEIADRLEQEGFIDSADELLELISYWGLDSMIVSGDYDLTSDMSVHQIAEIITNGAYYYIP